MNQGPRVYVVHESTRLDPVTGAVVGDKDLTPAARWGELVHVVPPGRQTVDPRPVVELINRELDGITEEDYLLLTGYPEYIAVAAVIAARNLGGKLKVLKWIRGERCYAPITLDIPWDDPLIDADEASWEDGVLRITAASYYDDFERVRDAIFLAGVTIPIEQVSSWTSEQRRLAAEWALSYHVGATDEDVVVPPRPDFIHLEKY